MFPTPDHVQPVCRLRDGRVEVCLERYDDPHQPTRLQVWKGRRCLVEIFDPQDTVPQALAGPLSTAAAPARHVEGVSLDPLERALCIVLGRGAVWAGAPADQPTLDRDVHLAALTVRRRVIWRVGRLRGWWSPRVVLWTRSSSQARTGVQRSGKETWNWFTMTPDEARMLAEALGKLRTA